MLALIADGEPPLRAGAFAKMAGYSVFFIYKMIRAGAIQSVGLTKERRIPVHEARRILVELGVIRAVTSQQSQQSKQTQRIAANS